MSGGLLSSPLPWPCKNKRIAVPAALSMLEKMTLTNLQGYTHSWADRTFKDWL